MTLASLLVFAIGADAASVDATRAYREHFGDPPKTEGARCLAAVVYLPGIGASGSATRLSPLPLFSINPERVAEEAARVVVQGYPTSVRRFRPAALFPSGTQFVGLDIAQGVATVEVTRGLSEADQPLALQALAHTLAQFDNVRSVALRVEAGSVTAPMAPQGEVVEAPAAPRLLDVVSSIHEGETPAEIDVLFDRPVDVSSFALRLGDGTGLPGRTYTSMFDMAIVYRPNDAAVLREGLPLDLEWKVRDRKGRVGEGRQSIGLRIYRHPE